MTSSLQEAFLSHRGRTSGILGAILASLGASWGHLGHTWGHLGIHSAIWEVWLHALKLTTLSAHTWGHLGIPSAVWEIWLHALRLATLSALPVPMVRQVYVRPLKPRFRSGHHQTTGPSRCQFDVVKTPSLQEAILSHLGAILAVLGAILAIPGALLGPSGGHLGAILAYLGSSWAILGHLGTILGPSWLTWGHLGAILGPSWDQEGCQEQAGGAINSNFAKS